MAILAERSLSASDLDRTDRIQRRRREAIEELRRNGVTVSKRWAQGLDEYGLEMPALNVTDFGADDFHSEPGARPIAENEVCNVTSITEEELQLTLAEVAERIGSTKCRHAYPEWSAGKPEWPSDDLRWTLTPHALRRLSCK